jgi:hypothetical protein
MNKSKKPSKPEEERVTGLTLRLLVGAAAIVPAGARHLMEHSFDIVFDLIERLLEIYINI